MQTDFKTNRSEQRRDNGRKFYERYDFMLMEEKVYEAIGDLILRLIYKLS